MRKTNFITTIMLTMFFLFANVNAQEIIGTGELKIELTQVTSGVKISSVKKGDTELLDTGPLSPLFVIYVNEEFVQSAIGWGDVEIINDGTECTVTLGSPTSSKLPSTLKAVVTINVVGKKSDWGLSISGLGENHSLMDVRFPYINILAKGNDYALIPLHSGQLIKNPKGSAINVALQYPRWAATMQFMAYYNDDYGVYIGTHDPKAYVKVLVAEANTKNGVKFQTNIPVPNRTINGNDWEYPGKFHLELFEGDWFDASMIYRKWASQEAEYWPKDTPDVLARREASGNINVWFYHWDDNYSMDYIKDMVNRFADYMGVPIGVHWYKWNYLKIDDNYPYFFPERTGMGDMVKEVEATGKATFMPYTNGRLYDKDLPNYETEGKVWGAKQLDGSVYSQSFNGENFAVECPTQTGYQDLMVYAAERLTDSSQIGCGALYIDQTAYSMFVQCYDPNHGHKIGGGSFWRDGYKQMFEKMHAATEDDKFFASEGNCDFIADETDLFLAQMWRNNNLVPAFQAVYSGKVHFFGTRGGTEASQWFFGAYANSFVAGVTPGRFYISALDDYKGINTYIRRMARMHYKLKEYLAFGRMLKPIPIDRSSIPDVTYHSGLENVTISSLQSSFWKNRDEDKTMVLFANASMSDSISYTFEFDGSTRGLYGNLKIQKITETEDGAVENKDNVFSMDITLAPKDIIAYIIEADTMVSSMDESSVWESSFELMQNYPNPFNPVTEIAFSIPKTSLTSLVVYDVLGRKVAELLNKELTPGSYQYKFDATALSSGLYFYRLQSGNYVKIKKMMLMK